MRPLRVWAGARRFHSSSVILFIYFYSSCIRFPALYSSSTHRARFTSPSSQVSENVVCVSGTRVVIYIVMCSSLVKIVIILGMWR